MRDVISADPEGNAGAQLFAVKSVQEFDALPGTEVFARMLKTLSTSRPEFAEAVRRSESKIIGTLPEGDQIAHVLYRMQTGVAEIKANQVSVITLQRSGNAWRACLTGNFEGIARALGSRR